MLPGSLQAMAEKGTQIVNISPLKDDLHSGADFQWIAIKPNTDMALMLALAYHIHETGKHDQAFLNRYNEGFEQFKSSLLGKADRKSVVSGTGVSVLLEIGGRSI